MRALVFMLLLALPMSVGNARKEAAKRWIPGSYQMLVDQTKTTYSYELRIKVKECAYLLMGSRTRTQDYIFTGTSWEDVLWKSRNIHQLLPLTKPDGQKC